MTLLTQIFPSESFLFRALLSKSHSLHFCLLPTPSSALFLWSIHTHTLGSTSRFIQHWHSTQRANHKMVQNLGSMDLWLTCECLWVTKCFYKPELGPLHSVVLYSVCPTVLLCQGSLSEVLMDYQTDLLKDSDGWESFIDHCPKIRPKTCFLTWVEDFACHFKLRTWFLAFSS